MSTSLLSSLAAGLTTRNGAVLGAAAVAGLALMVSIGGPGRGSAVATETKPQAAASASTFTDAQKTEIGAIVRDYLLANPQILIEVNRELEKRQASLQAEQQGKVIVEKQDELFRSDLDFVMGNPNGKITVIEYFDYNCGWCKRAVDELNKLVEKDKDLRIVLKEFPIFGENSQTAALAAMASLRQGKYWPFHVALMKEKQVTKDNVFTIAQSVGLDIAKLKADMADPKLDAAIKATTETAVALGIEGTPGFVVGDRVNVGFLPAPGILQIVSDLRKTGCKVC